MDRVTFDEITSILAMHGRPDLIAEMKELEIKIVDADYVPTRPRRDSLSDSEGSAITEDSFEVEEDDEGFLSLK
jgi:hypothetical protein